MSDLLGTDPTLLNLKAYGEEYVTGYVRNKYGSMENFVRWLYSQDDELTKKNPDVIAARSGLPPHVIRALKGHNSYQKAVTNWLKHQVFDDVTMLEIFEGYKGMALNSKSQLIKLKASDKILEIKEVLNKEDSEKTLNVIYTRRLDPLEQAHVIKTAPGEANLTAGEAQASDSEKGAFPQLPSPSVEDAEFRDISEASVSDESDISGYESNERSLSQREESPSVIGFRFTPSRRQQLKLNQKDKDKTDIRNVPKENQVNSSLHSNKVLPSGLNAPTGKPTVYAPGASKALSPTENVEKVLRDFNNDSEVKGSRESDSDRSTEVLRNRKRNPRGSRA